VVAGLAKQAEAHFAVMAAAAALRPPEAAEKQPEASLADTVVEIVETVLDELEERAMISATLLRTQRGVQ